MSANFICGCAQSSETITFAARDKDDPDFEEPFGPSLVIELSHGLWRRRKIDGWLEDLALDPDGQVMALTSDRQFIRPALDGAIEKISEPRPPLAALLHGLRAIGSSIYACGGNGLIYRRGRDGWQGFAEELLTPFPVRPDNYFMVIDGASEDQIYLLAQEGVFVWDGARSHRLDLPKSMLVGIHIERPDLVWLCGWNGMLMRGSFRDGFARIANPGRQMFLSVAAFEGRLYLAGDNKLWAYDGTEIAPVDVGGKRRPIRNLTCAKDALWAVGDDILRLKVGAAWERIPYEPPWLSR